MGRKLLTLLPRAKSTMNSPVLHKLRQLKHRQKFYFDRTAKPLPPLNVDDRVRVFNTERREWTREGTVLQEVAPRSYTVLTDAGAVVRRNRTQLLKTPSHSTQDNHVVAQDDLLTNSAQQGVTGGELPVPMNAPVNLPEPSLAEPLLRKSGRTVKVPERLDI
ncbi:UNVERIFIED_CONTAM: hypothetical protein FKN15_013595 [Acipenser sinensis]